MDSLIDNAKPVKVAEELTYVQKVAKFISGIRGELLRVVLWIPSKVERIALFTVISRIGS